jgi:hypothetical protein
LIFPCLVGNHIRPSAFQSWLRGLRTPSPSPLCEGHGSQFFKSVAMNTEKFEGYHEAREALVLSVAGVTAVMLIESLVLLILY